MILFARGPRKVLTAAPSFPPPTVKRPPSMVCCKFCSASALIGAWWLTSIFCRTRHPINCIKNGFQRLKTCHIVPHGRPRSSNLSTCTQPRFIVFVDAVRFGCEVRSVHFASTASFSDRICCLYVLRCLLFILSHRFRTVRVPHLAAAPHALRLAVQPEALQHKRMAGRLLMIQP